MLVISLFFVLFFYGTATTEIHTYGHSLSLTDAFPILHAQGRHTAVVLRDREVTQIDVADLVPGDVVRLTTGTVVPADMRVLDGRNLSCDEAIVTGESLPVSKSAAAVAQGAGVGDLTSCLLMGTVVQSGDARSEEHTSELQSLMRISYAVF